MHASELRAELLLRRRAHLLPSPRLHRLLQEEWAQAALWTGECAVCLETMQQPCTTPCGHTLCAFCAYELFVRGRACPLCRAPLRRGLAFPCLLLGALTAARKPHKRERWAGACELRVGDRLDVRDSQAVWCVGEVAGSFPNAGHAPTLLVHYVGWESEYDEFICCNSPRLAPAGMFTRRRDLARYVIGRGRVTLRAGSSPGSVEGEAESEGA